MRRLVGFRWRPGHYEGRRAAEAYAAHLTETGAWRQILSVRGFLLLISELGADIDPLILSGNAGIVLGAMFTETDSEFRRLAEVDAERIKAWAETDARSLGETCWGNYLAIVVDAARDRILVVRDPMGARPCFIRQADADGVRIIFSDLEDLALCVPLPDIDEGFLGLYLAQPRIVHERTGLQGVREVLAGECYALWPDHDTSTLIWTLPARQIEWADGDASEMAQNLRSRIFRACASWTSLDLPFLHRLSGGLDSAIALAALRAAGAPMVCVNEWPIGFAEGDEREAARAVARQFGVQLIELGYHPRDIDYRKLIEAPLSPKPSISLLSFADPHFQDLAEAGALLTSGQGGDQIFHRGGAICTLADAVRDRVRPSNLVSLALESARASRRSVWPALKAGLEFGVLRSPRAYVEKHLRDAAARHAPDHASAAAAAAAALEDPWVRNAFQRGPGEAMRAVHIADLQYYHNLSLPSLRFVPTPVLTSQPIVEFCCTVPTYRTFHGGRDRALARMAFEADLPPASVDRKRKGDTTRFFAQVAAVNADFLNSMLVGGELEARGLFNAARLKDKPKHAVVDFSHQLVAEIWLRSIKERRLSQVHSLAPAPA